MNTPAPALDPRGSHILRTCSHYRPTARAWCNAVLPPARPSAR